MPALVNLVGPHRAKEMLILGRTYGMEELDGWGFFTETVSSDGELVPAAERLAEAIVNQPLVPVTSSKASIVGQHQHFHRRVNLAA